MRWRADHSPRSILARVSSLFQLTVAEQEQAAGSAGGRLTELIATAQPSGAELGRTAVLDPVDAGQESGFVRGFVGGGLEGDDRSGFVVEPEQPGYWRFWLAFAPEWFYSMD